MWVRRDSSRQAASQEGTVASFEDPLGMFPSVCQSCKKARFDAGKRANKVETGYLQVGYARGARVPCSQCNIPAVQGYNIGMAKAFGHVNPVGKVITPQEEPSIHQHFLSLMRPLLNVSPSLG